MGCGNSKSNGKKDSSSSSNNKLPADIIFEILTRVPAESLVRFKVVCKLWKAIISDPDFISSHLHIWRSKPAFIFTSDLSSDRLLLSDFHDPTDFTIRIPQGYRHIVASTDGLLLLKGFRHKGRDGLETKLCVHNPVTGSQKSLPTNLNHRMDNGSDRFLIVHDASIQKYKGLVFIDDGSERNVKINVITVDNDGEQGSLEWRELISPSTFRLEGVFKPITVNGILYWLAYTTTYDHINQLAFVQSMDIAKEEFTQGLSLPCQPKSDSYHQLINWNLLEMKGSIYLSNPATDMELELWMLEDLGNQIWVMKHKICLVSIVGKPNRMSSFLVSDSFYPIQMIGNHGLMIILHDSCIMNVLRNDDDDVLGYRDEDDVDFLDGMGWYLHALRRLEARWYLYNLRRQEVKAIVGRPTEANIRYYHYHSREPVTLARSLVGWN